LDLNIKNRALPYLHRQGATAREIVHFRERKCVFSISNVHTSSTAKCGRTTQYTAFHRRYEVLCPGSTLLISVRGG